MKRNLTLVFGLIIVTLSHAQLSTSIYDYSVKLIQGDTLHFSDYAGKKLMLVNTASFCAYTPQYEQLEALYTQYRSYNFEIIGLPSDDFGRQGGSDTEIVSTCAGYDVTFPITEKVNVNASPVHPVFQWLKTASLNGVADASVTWNFNKFLINADGTWEQHYESNVLPNDVRIVEWITAGFSSIGSENISNSSNYIHYDPAANSLKVILASKAEQYANISVYSCDGRVIYSQKHELISGFPSFCSLPAIASGVYMVKVSGGGHSFSGRFFK